MGITRFALKLPHRFYVLTGLMLFFGVSAILVTPKDIFPNIDIPVVSAIWQYIGLSPSSLSCGMLKISTDVINYDLLAFICSEASHEHPWE